MGVVIKRTLYALLVSGALSAPASAAVINIGFEQGLTGWSTTGNVVADNTLAHDGVFSALIKAEEPHTNPPSSLSQIFNLNSGETITFYAQFTSVRQNPPGTDTASVHIGPAGSPAVLQSWVVPAGNGTIVGPWQTISFTAPSAGSYEFRALVNNVGNETGLSTLRIDSFQTIPSAVPEPSTWAMMILGFAALGFVAYRRSRKLAAAAT
jgi:hypothetical protein